MQAEKDAEDATRRQKQEQERKAQEEAEQKRRFKVEQHKVGAVAAIYECDADNGCTVKVMATFIKDSELIMKQDEPGGNGFSTHILRKSLSEGIDSGLFKHGRTQNHFKVGVIPNDLPVLKKYRDYEKNKILPREEATTKLGSAFLAVKKYPFEVFLLLLMFFGGILEAAQDLDIRYHLSQPSEILKSNTSDSLPRNTLFNPFTNTQQYYTNWTCPFHDVPFSSNADWECLSRYPVVMGDDYNKITVPWMVDTRLMWTQPLSYASPNNATNISIITSLANESPINGDLSYLQNILNQTNDIIAGMTSINNFHIFRILVL
jgi:hypothetical protein